MQGKMLSKFGGWVSKVRKSACASMRTRGQVPNINIKI